MAITIHSAGCCLLDYLYREVDFSGAAVQALLSRTPGDGGLTIGGLVFAHSLERFAGRPLAGVIGEIAGGRSPDARNLGGPAIVAAVHAAQLCHDRDITVRFFGGHGNDATADSLMEILRRTPVDVTGYRGRDGSTPATYVFSDPHYDGGHGERLFVNDLGVAAHTSRTDLGSDFPRADIVQLGGTALVPPLHDELHLALRDARTAGALTVVNTVYDFRAESQRPGERWPLGSDEAYPRIDLLIADLEEARRLTATSDARQALDWLRRAGVAAAIITSGPQPIWYYAAGPRFVACGPESAPVCAVDRQFTVGDTTGCGDNFVGGVIASIAGQLESGVDRIDLADAVAWGAVSGAHCLSYLGGTYVETRPGEKAAQLQPLRSKYGRISGAP